MFMYVMGVFGTLLPGDLLRNYYLISSAFLAIPTLLSARELMRIIEIRGMPRNRVLWYFVVTPALAILTLANWYIIGVWLTLLALRKYLEGGSRPLVGVLLGLSAATNLVTAVPGIGLLFAERKGREALVLASTALGTYGLINLPFVVLNAGLWYQSWQYIYNWNIENSWMGAFLLNPYSPYRHVIPTVVFAGVVAWMLWLRYRKMVRDPVVFAFVAMFGYTFATYIYPPQMDLALLPFFVLLPVCGYREFLAFDVANALIIILGASQVLLPFGINYYNLLHPMTYSPNYPYTAVLDLTASPLFWLGVIRSFWEGKLLFVNGMPGFLSLKRGRGGGWAARVQDPSKLVTITAVPMTVKTAIERYLIRLGDRTLPRRLPSAVSTATAPMSPSTQPEKTRRASSNLASRTTVTSSVASPARSSAISVRTAGTKTAHAPVALFSRSFSSLASSPAPSRDDLYTSQAA